MVVFLLGSVWETPTSLTQSSPVNHLHHHHIVVRGQLAKLVLEFQHSLHQGHDIVVHEVIGPVQVGCGLNALEREGWMASGSQEPGGPLTTIIHSWEHTDINQGRGLCFATTVLCPRGRDTPSASGVTVLQLGVGWGKQNVSVLSSQLRVKSILSWSPRYLNISPVIFV